MKIKATINALIYILCIKLVSSKSKKDDCYISITCPEKLSADNLQFDFKFNQIIKAERGPRGSQGPKGLQGPRGPSGRDGLIGCASSFTVSLDHQNKSDLNGKIIFKKIINNYGRHYLVEDGVYAVPFDGVYEFTVSGISTDVQVSVI
ncbi:hypothetical protein GJ496_001747 [Pomphorhynchus laevis]|nr:hypothetical protein GJ496_001747 [Pomphorhynchus laevis]